MDRRHPDWLPYWQPNHTTDKCMLCHAPFSNVIFDGGKERHHCRECGKLVCQSCWGKTKYLSAYYKAVPVCDFCFNLTTDPNAIINVPMEEN